MPDRTITHRYDDPVDLIWLRAAKDLSLNIRRSTEVFASYDGHGTLTISESSDFDADDCLAQMIFHEICHWLVAGRRGYKLEDWGMSNIDDSDIVYEYAAIRLQAALSRPFGLKGFMAVTTDWRAYWDSLPDNPLAEGDDPAIGLALEAYHLSRMEPFAAVLERSLSATAAIADSMRNFAGSESLWSLTRPRHRLGSLLHESQNLDCGSCAWSFPDSGCHRCRQHTNEDASASVVQPDERACEKWEPKISPQRCGSCGACCRGGFDHVQIELSDPFMEMHRDLVQIRDSGEAILPRPDGICVLLQGDGSDSDQYRCRRYDSRPSNCVEFEVAGDACLLARQRIGLSR